MSWFSIRCIAVLLYERLKKLHSLVVERCCAERPEQSQGSRFVAGDSVPLTAERAVSAMGFEQEGMKGLKRGEKEERNKEDDRISESRGAGKPPMPSI